MAATALEAAQVRRRLVPAGLLRDFAPSPNGGRTGVAAPHDP
jgi:hypothetical protein